MGSNFSKGDNHTGHQQVIVNFTEGNDAVVGKSIRNKGGTAVKKVFTRSNVELMSLLLPVWYTLEPLTNDEIVVARDSWNLILQDTSEEFLRLKGTEGFPYHSAVVWFFDTFYQRFFDVHPSVKPLFKNGLVTQGRFLVKMISLLLSELDLNEKFDQALHKLVVTHNTKGVKASEYGLVGEIIFYTMRKCIGPAYTVAVSRAWIKVFSRMLKVIIPKAVALELNTEGEHQAARFKSYDDDEQHSEYMETERRQELVRLAKEGNQCPFTHDAAENRAVHHRKTTVEVGKLKPEDMDDITKAVA